MIYCANHELTEIAFAYFDETFTERVIAELRAARCTWNPYDLAP